MISYAPFWKTLKKRGLNQYRLIKDYGIDTGLLHRLRKDLYIELYSAERLCHLLDCRIEDIVEIYRDEKSEKTEGAVAKQEEI